jgi:hypothetical protein
VRVGSVASDQRDFDAHGEGCQDPRFTAFCGNRNGLTMLEILCDTDSEMGGALYVDAQQMGPLPKAFPCSISITRWRLPTRRRIECFIEKTGWRQHGSLVTRHYPFLLGVRGSQRQVIAATGLRFAADEPLLLEQHLIQPIEAALSAKLGEAIKRKSIVEVGDLLLADRRAAVLAFLSLLAYLRQQNVGYAVAVGTAAIRRSFAIFGVHYTELAHARMREARIIGGSIQPAFDRLERYLPPLHNLDLARFLSPGKRPVAAVIRAFSY